jgi:nitrite reductase/ring-hydroxylating ferredoxin subunit
VAEEDIAFMSDSDSRPEEGAVEERRGFLARTAAVSMGAGLIVGYGTLAAYAGRYLFTIQDDRVWLFVTDVASLPPGASMPFESPTGVRVTVTRRAASDPNGEAPASDFMALSSVCPHLGCRVHWEAQNNRFFCPCHNGVFDPEGQATDGPPKAANQELPRYPLKVENGLVFLEMPLNAVGAERQTFLKTSASVAPSESRIT